MSGQELLVVDYVRDLGVTVTADLDLSRHILDGTKSARTIVNCIFRCFVVNNPDFRIRLYTALLASRLLC